MSNLVLRQQKGSPLEWAEVDGNFTALRDAIEGVYSASTNGQLAGMRNKIINGKMEIAQRGTSGTSANTYALDRWISSHSGTAHTWAQVTGGSLAGVYFGSLLQLNGAAGNNGVAIVQRVEALNSADLTNQTVTFSAYVLHVGTGGARTVAITIQRPDARDNWTGATIIASSGNISVPLNTWTRITWTTTLPASGPELGLSFELGFGAITAGQQFFVTGVQLEVGSVATPFEHRTYGAELALCERYYQSINEAPSYAGTATYTGATFYVTAWLRNRMRASPTTTSFWSNGVNAVGGPIVTTVNLIHAQLFATALGVNYSADLNLTFVSAEL